jgi:DNA polymerase-3 subunit epsilon/oligoribonuclease
VLGIFLDTEANGLNPQVHKVIELAYKIVDLSTGEIKEEFESIVAQPEDAWKKSDPNSLKVNGFTWEDMQKGRSIEHIAKETLHLFKKWGIIRRKAVFICQNPSFDRAFFSQLIDSDTQERLQWPYHWLDLASMYWAICMDKAKQKKGPLPWETGYSKDMIAKQYNIPPEQHPHKAMNGVAHLLLCYKAVVGFPNGQTPQS